MSKQDKAPEAPKNAPQAPEAEPQEAQGVTEDERIAAAVVAAMRAVQPGRKRRVTVEESTGARPKSKMPRTPEQDADPNLFYNGQVYQVTPEARMREVREIRQRRQLINDPFEMARKAALDAAAAIARG